MLTLKTQKKLYLEGKLDKLPWEDYVSNRDYIVKENAVQVKKTIDDSEPVQPTQTDSYIQNAEQNENSLWIKIKNQKQQ